MHDDIIHDDVIQYDVIHDDVIHDDVVHYDVIQDDVIQDDVIHYDVIRRPLEVFEGNVSGEGEGVVLQMISQHPQAVGKSSFVNLRIFVVQEITRKFCGC